MSYLDAAALELPNLVLSAPKVQAQDIFLLPCLSEIPENSNCWYGRIVILGKEGKETFYKFDVKSEKLKEVK